jgi:hypothetical protein
MDEEEAPEVSPEADARGLRLAGLGALAVLIAIVLSRPSPARLCATP